jgi:transcriptional regulator with XRE-family HTH domain
MMSSKLQEWVNATPERQRIYAQEDLILQAGEMIHAAMERRGVNRARLAERLGCSAPHVTQILSGERNMTLRRLADIAHALGYRVELKLKRRTSRTGPSQ